MHEGVFEDQNIADQAEEYLRRVNDAATYCAEMLDGNMRTEFVFRFDGQELYAEDGRPITPIFDDAIADAEKLAADNPLLDFEVRRRKEERHGELEDILSMLSGNLGNTIFVMSDFPSELTNSETNVGGYNVVRQQAMARVISLRPDGTIVVQSQSLDQSNRQALEAIYIKRFGKIPAPGELLGQREHLNLDPDEQKYLIDEITGIYDSEMTAQFNGEWYAGRRPANRSNTYSFTMDQFDLLDAFAIETMRKDKKINDKHLLYQLAASMEERWKGIRRVGVRDALHEMRLAGQQAAAEQKSFSGCGLTLESDLSEAGYGNKIKEMHCPFCKASQYGDPCSPNQKCTSCKAEVRDGKVTYRGDGGKKFGLFVADSLLPIEKAT